MQSSIERQTSVVDNMGSLLSDEKKEKESSSPSELQSKIVKFSSVLKWLIVQSLLNKQPLEASLLLFVFRQCSNESEKKAFVETLLDVCKQVLKPPVFKLDWIWFNTYLIHSAVNLFFCLFFGKQQSAHIFCPQIWFEKYPGSENPKS